MVQQTATFTINGQSHPYRAQTIYELLVATGRDPDQRGIAVAVNDEIITRSRWRTTELQPHDQVEIVQAVAGG